MLAFPGVNVKTGFVYFEAHTIYDSGAEKQLCALHVVVHYVFENGHKRVWTNLVEVNTVLGDNLYSDISFDISCKTFQVNLVIRRPIIVTFFILVSFEKQY